MDLASVIIEVKNNLQGKADASGVIVDCEMESVMVSADGHMIFELVYNLLDNAIKYNKQGGHVKITVGIKDKKAQIIVSDTGIGIPKEHLDRVFERFYRVDKSHSKQTGGTGLGLSIVKHIAAYHNGIIEIESKEGIGTTIKVEI